LVAAAPEGTDATFYRTSAGAEIDLVLTLPGDVLWAIEIKRGSAPKVGRGFHQACVDLSPAKQIVVYGGMERFPLNAETEAVGLAEMAALLQSFA
jgi:predicted AAA+ superfamily ATPase